MQTNTWRPKKLNIKDTPTGSWGTNGSFYLPFDGSAPIGEDQSGGNDWTKVIGTLVGS